MKKMSLVTGTAVGALLAVGVASRADAAAQDQVAALPTQVKAEVAAAAPTPKPSWADNTSVNGRMYFDLSHIEHKSNGVKQSDTGTGFDIKRFYVGIDHKFDDTFSGAITTDVTYNSGQQVDVYVKKAYLQAKVNDALTLRFGSADMPWMPFAEDVYGLRYIENTVADRTKYGASADWGVHAMGKVGMLSYAVSAINGNGYKNPTRSKSVDFEGRLSTTFEGVTLGVGGYTGKLGKDVEGATTRHDATRWDAIAGYKYEGFRIGAEYFQTRNWNSVTSVNTDSANGASLFASYAFTPEISAFGRYDWIRKTSTGNPSARDNYFNLGLQWEPAKIVDFALVYKRDEARRGAFSTSNGTIGAAGINGKGTYDEFGVWGQYRW